MSNKLNSFLGDSLMRTVIKLLIISFVVGILLSYFNLTPYEIWVGLKNFVIRLYDLGFEAIWKIAQYIIGGALVVVPIFLILRLIKSGK